MISLTSGSSSRNLSTIFGFPADFTLPDLVTASLQSGADRDREYTRQDDTQRKRSGRVDNRN